MEILCFPCITKTFSKFFLIYFLLKFIIFFALGSNFSLIVQESLDTASGYGPHFFLLLRFCEDRLQ